MTINRNCSFLSFSVSNGGVEFWWIWEIWGTSVLKVYFSFNGVMGPRNDLNNNRHKNSHFLKIFVCDPFSLNTIFSLNLTYYFFRNLKKLKVSHYGLNITYMVISRSKNVVSTKNDPLGLHFRAKRAILAQESQNLKRRWGIRFWYVSFMLTMLFTEKGSQTRTSLKSGYFHADCCLNCFMAP